MDHMEDRLNALWAEYREACPDPEPSAQFMPQLWQRIEANRGATVSLLLRRWAEVWLVATLTLAIVMGAFLIPRFQSPPAYQASYIDVLAAADSAADSANDVAVIPVSETE
jgi:anti-sigma-K factor RskA